MCSLILTLVSCYALAGSNTAEAFSLPSRTAVASPSRCAFLLPTTTTTTTTRLYAAKKRKLSYAQKKKKRGKKQVDTVAGGVGPSDGVRPDVWDPVTSSASSKREDRASSTPTDDHATEVRAQAATMIENQRASVAMLTHVKEAVEALPMGAVRRDLLASNGYYHVVDGFLHAPEIVDKLAAEARSLLRQDKLAVLQLGSGEYGAPLAGGEDYAASPRSIEYVVSLTRHFATQFNNVTDDDVELTLDATASMGSVMAFDRKARLAGAELLPQHDDDDTKPFATFTNDVEDVRKVTALYFTTDEGWDDGDECGGGIEIKQGSDGDVVLVKAKRDRLVLIRSDQCLHRREEWRGRDGMEYGGCLVTHLCRERV